MEAKRNKNLCLLLLCALTFGGFIEANSLSYDYTSNVECLGRPEKPQYDGGIIENPELREGLKGWSTFGDAKIEGRESEGNHFIVAHSRKNPYDSFSQKLYLQSNHLYSFSAWIKVNEGDDVVVKAIFKIGSVYKHVGRILAQSKCWSMLKAGLSVDASAPAELYFESNNTSVEIWADSISLQPFTREEWKVHQDESIEKVRKRKVRFLAKDEQGNPLSNTTIIIQLKRPRFPFGCAINKNILNNPSYENWFTSRAFTVTAFENEMKWYTNEPRQGYLDYSAADAMLQWAHQHNIAVRAHNIFWDDPRYQQGWIQALSPQQLQSAANGRLNSIMSRYRGQVIAWDVVNENLHFNFFESKMGPTTSGLFYNWAIKAGGGTTLFLNDYNTIEESGDAQSSPGNYLAKLRRIRSFPGNQGGSFAIGLESHFSVPNIAYMRSSIDTLGSAGVPIWITELDVQKGPNQADYLEQILREAFSHPKVSGIVIWAAWQPSGCYQMCLTDNNFHNLPTGDVVDKLLHEWAMMTNSTMEATTDDNGSFDTSLFHGDYEVKIMTHPSVNSFSPIASTAKNFSVEPSESLSQHTTLLLEIAV